MAFVLVAHTLFTLAMFGLMWSVQIIIYPQFRVVEPAAFVAYAEHHSRRIVIGLAFLAPFEILFAAWLWLDPPAGISSGEAFVSGALLAAGWVSTALWFAPLHAKLQQGHDADKIESLIATNGVRTCIWTLRAVLVCRFLAAG